MALVYETIVGQDLDLGTGAVSKTAPGGGTLNGTQISISTLGLNGATTSAITATWAPGALSALGYATTTATVTGAVVGDMVLASLTTQVTNAAMLTAHVSAANTVTVVIYNPTSTAMTIASGTLKVLVLRAK